MYILNMKNSKFLIDKLGKLFEQGIISSKDLTSELFNILKSKRDEIVFKMKLVSKDEFEVLTKRVENLENKIKKLETKKKAKRVKKS
jgi:polyhydroxyalkanoate synthesis regulator phasin